MMEGVNIRPVMLDDCQSLILALKWCRVRTMSRPWLAVVTVLCAVNLFANIVVLFVTGNVHVRLNACEDITQSFSKNEFGGIDLQHSIRFIGATDEDPGFVIGKTEPYHLEEQFRWYRDGPAL